MGDRPKDLIETRVENKQCPICGIALEGKITKKMKATRFGEIEVCAEHYIGD